MSTVFSTLATCAAVPLVVWGAATLVPELRRYRLWLVAASAALAVVAGTSSAVAIESSDAAVLLVAGPVALVTLVALALGMVAVGWFAIRRVFFLTSQLRRFWRAARRLQSGHPESAIDDFEEIANHPHTRSALRGAALNNLGAALSQVGRLAAAKAALEQSLALPRGRAQRALVLYNLAWVAYLEQEFETAARRHGEAVAAGPRGADLRSLTALMEARLATRAGDLAAAEHAISAARSAAAGSRNAELRTAIELQDGIVRYLGGDGSAGRAQILASLDGQRTPYGRHLAALWLAGLSAVARAEDSAVFLARANELEGRDLTSEAPRLAAYLKGAAGT